MRKKYIKGFYFNKARYFISDSVGNSFYLNINYKDNGFKLTQIKKKDGKIMDLKMEANKVAEDLLRRKSRVNFA